MKKPIAPIIPIKPKKCYTVYDKDISLSFEGECDKTISFTDIIDKIGKRLSISREDVLELVSIRELTIEDKHHYKGRISGGPKLVNGSFSVRIRQENPYYELQLVKYEEEQNTYLSRQEEYKKELEEFYNWKHENRKKELRLDAEKRIRIAMEDLAKLDAES